VWWSVRTRTGKFAMWTALVRVTRTYRTRTRSSCQCKPALTLGLLIIDMLHFVAQQLNKLNLSNSFIEHWWQVNYEFCACTLQWLWMLKLGLGLVSVWTRSNSGRIAWLNTVQKLCNPIQSPWPWRPLCPSLTTKYNPVKQYSCHYRRFSLLLM